MSALSGGYVQDALHLVAGGHSHALRWSRARRLRTWHVHVARQALGRHVQEATEEGNRRRQWMHNLCAIGIAPGAIVKCSSVTRQLRDRRVHGRENLIVPRLERRVQQVRRPFGEQLPHRTLPTQRSRVVERRVHRGGRRREHGHHLPH